MNKKISLTLAVLFILSFAGCGKELQKSENEIRNVDLSRPAKVHNTVPETQNNTAQETEDLDTERPLEEGKKQIHGVDLSDVRTQILNDCAISDSMLLETEALERLYSIDISKVKQSASFVTMSGTFPHEIIMVEASDESSADEIVNLLNSRLSEVMVQSKSYDAKNYALAQRCKVVKKGNHISLFLSPEFEKMMSIYEGYIK